MSFVRGYWVLALGVVLIALGIVSGVPFVRSTISVGWTAYAPLTSTTFTPPYAPYFPFVLLTLGLILASGWTGYRLAHRKQANPRPGPNRP